ncbi:MAG: DUF4097 family beta strand repeat protein [Firmicutes bacterium]|nr:DUF4097 family beta strand repeat protein [Bacillota bacterium]
MKKYLEDLRQELQKQKLTSKEIEEIIADHEEMIRTAMEEGLSEEQIKAKFGQPKQVAEELADNNEDVVAEQDDNDDLVLWKTYQVEHDSLSVDVNLISEDITYQLSDSSEIKVYYEGKAKVEKYEISYEKNEFRLSAPKRLGFNFSFGKGDDLRFVVELPKHVVVKELKHVTISSDSTFKNLKVNDLKVNTTSGDLVITHNQIEKFKLNSVSGDCSIEDSKIVEFNLSQVSGDTELDHVTISGNFKANTVSGDVELNDVTCEDFEMHAVSGDVDGKEFYPKKVTLKSVSGDVNIKNQEKRYIEIVKKSTLSGEINIG